MKRSPNQQYALLAILFAWSAIALIILIQNQLREEVQLPFVLSDYSLVIDFVPPPDRHATQLRKGDELVSIDGKTVAGWADLAAIQTRMKPGETHLVMVRRGGDGATSTLSLPVTAQVKTRDALAWIYIIGILVVFPILCLLVGFYIAFARPSDPLAWITLAMLASFGQLWAGSNVIAWAAPSPLRELVIVYHVLLADTWPLWMLLFGLYFPRPFDFLRGQLWIVWAAAIIPVSLAAVGIYGSLMQGYHVAELHGLYAFAARLTWPTTIMSALYITAFFASLRAKYSWLRDPDAARRLRIMIIGCGIPLTALLPFLFDQLGLTPMLPPWLAVGALLLQPLFPLTMAYVIVVKKAMDVEMVVRSGLQHAAATATVGVLSLILIIAIGAITLELAKQSEHRFVGIAIFAAGVSAVFWLSRAAGQIGKWIDRRFFREAYNAERILTDLSSSVASIRDPKRLVETVAQRVAASLHVPRVAILLHDAGRFQPAYALGYGESAPKVELAEQTSTVRTLSRLNGPSKIYFDDPQSWVHGTSEVEQNALQQLDSEVLLPVTMDNKMLGIISLSPKRSELPYSRADLQLLSAVAAQTGLALANAHLNDSIRREVAQRERLDRELEIARDVQQRLFPQKLPQVQGLDFAGYCRPALGVGGDYYDFIHLSSGSLGIAVGDVSGKGIAAALMMASLQASLRGQTIKPCETLSEMIHHINGLVYEASASNRYATFFYAEFDPATRRLRYVNAGHNPPILRRAHADGSVEFLRLEEGGTVLGLFPDFCYREAVIELQSGDVLVAYTDGISEAMNPQEEEFDEDRLIEAIRTLPKGSSANISSYVLEKVDAFAAGADQHDDMTIVVLRLV